MERRRAASNPHCTQAHSATRAPVPHTAHTGTAHARTWHVRVHRFLLAATSASLLTGSRESARARASPLATTCTGIASSIRCGAAPSRLSTAVGCWYLCLIRRPRAFASVVCHGGWPVRSRQPVPWWCKVHTCVLCAQKPRCATGLRSSSRTQRADTTTIVDRIATHTTGTVVFYSALAAPFFIQDFLARGQGPHAAQPCFPRSLARQLPQDHFRTDCGGRCGHTLSVVLRTALLW